MNAQNSKDVFDSDSAAEDVSTVGKHRAAIGRSAKSRAKPQNAAAVRTPGSRDGGERHIELSLDDLPLIEKGRSFALNELALYETRERNKKTINDYFLRRKTSLPPPVTVVLVETGEFVVVDGVTRYIAAAMDNAGTIDANVYKGTMAQVKILALRLNQHGEKLSINDIKRQIDRLDEEYGDNPLSTREMAKLVGISHTTVAAHRAVRGQSSLEGIQAMRRIKTPEEVRGAMVKSVFRLIEAQGDQVLADIVAALPGAMRKRFIDGLTTGRIENDETRHGTE